MSVEGGGRNHVSKMGHVITLITLKNMSMSVSVLIAPLAPMARPRNLTAPTACPRRNKMAVTIKKDIAHVYRVRIEKPLYGWANITIREWPNGGSIDVQSDYGNYAYSWNSIGDRTLREFLCGLDYHYFMGKTRGGGQMFSLKESIQELRKNVITRRRDGDMDKESARECWDHIKFISEHSGDTADAFSREFEGAYWFVDKLYGGEYMDIPFCEVDNPECVAFWERIWPIICAEWKKEIMSNVEVN
jgi:hypothetical protein